MKISKCCGAPIMDYAVTMCSDCKDHCDVVEGEAQTPWNSSEDMSAMAKKRAVLESIEEVKNEVEIRIFDTQINALISVIDKQLGGNYHPDLDSDISKLKKMLSECDLVDEQMKKYAMLKAVREGKVDKSIARLIYPTI